LASALEQPSALVRHCHCINLINSYVLTCQSHQLNGVDFLLFKNGLRAEQTQYDG
jgi:hypothetical protein